MARYELPPGLSPEEERAVIAALERILGAEGARLPAWALAGRTEALRLGGLQVRRHGERSWRLRGRVPFARAGTPPLVGRGDAK